MYVLDTDHLSLFQRRHPQIVARIQTTPLPQRATTIITVEEQFRGRLSQIKKARTPQEHIKACAALHEAVRFFSRIRILDFNDASHLRFEALRQAQIRIGSQDLRIAAIALSTNSVLVTRNRSDFAQVPGLIIDDWSV